jgi:hypothetical protein
MIDCVVVGYHESRRVPYLLGKRMTPALIVHFLELAKPLTVNRAVEARARAHADAVAAVERQFEEFCRGLPLAAGRYRQAPGATAL